MILTLYYRDPQFYSDNLSFHRNDLNVHVHQRKVCTFTTTKFILSFDIMRAIEMVLCIEYIQFSLKHLQFKINLYMNKLFSFILVCVFFFMWFYFLKINSFAGIKGRKERKSEGMLYSLFELYSISITCFSLEMH